MRLNPSGAEFDPRSICLRETQRQMLKRKSRMLTLIVIAVLFLA